MFCKQLSIPLLDNIIIKNASAYRSYQYQVNLYDTYVKKDGKEAADTYSARPGFSEHQTGLATDINEINRFDISNYYPQIIFCATFILILTGIIISNMRNKNEDL